MTQTGPTPTDVLPEGVSSRIVETGASLAMNVLEAGAPGAPRLLLLHGFPELAYSWRRVMPALADAGYHVIAPDQRGYGRTRVIGETGSASYEDDLSRVGMPALVADALALIEATGPAPVRAVIGHDFGSPVAAWCALIRPDIFPAVACMSAPFAGPPGWDAPGEGPDIHEALRALDPPRKHYQHYYAERGANGDMTGGDLAAFLRAYFHCKSGDWGANRPYTLSGRTAEALAELPRYYVMDADKGMAETAASMAPSAAEASACDWMTADDLAHYTKEYGRTGFQGGLNWYRRQISAAGAAEQRLFAGRRIEVPATFIAGARDWGVRQVPGALEAMETSVCADWRGTTLIDGAGHWVQQEAPQAVVSALLTFLEGVETR